MFQDRMTKLSNEDLVSIAYAALDQGYETQAIAAAKEELARRNVEADEVNTLRNEQEELDFADKNRVNAPLPWPGKVFFLLFGAFFVISAFAIFAMYTRGYKKMVEDALRYSLLNIFLLLSISLFISFT